jgi:hypothetical protein
LDAKIDDHGSSGNSGGSGTETTGSIRDFRTSIISTPDQRRPDSLDRSLPAAVVRRSCGPAAPR